MKPTSKFITHFAARHKQVLILPLMLLFISLILQTTPATDAWNDEMTLDDKTAVAPGKWGGTGIELLVTETGVEIEFDCANGEIDKKLMIDENGDFCVTGVFKRVAPGALRPGVEPKTDPARFEGKINGKDMSLKVTFIESGLEIGDFTLRLGEQANLRKCY